MLGKPILGKFIAYKSGHDLNNKLLEKIIESKNSWKITNLDLEKEDTSKLAKDYMLVKNESSYQEVDVASRCSQF